MSSLQNGFSLGVLIVTGPGAEAETRNRQMVPLRVNGYSSGLSMGEASGFRPLFWAPDREDTDTRERI